MSVHQRRPRWTMADDSVPRIVLQRMPDTRPTPRWGRVLGLGLVGLALLCAVVMGWWAR